MNNKTNNNKTPVDSTDVSYLLPWVILVVIIMYIFLKFAAPFVWAWVMGKDHALPTPGTLVLWYMLLTSLFTFLWVATSNERIETCLAFLWQNRSATQNVLRIAILTAIPLLIGETVYSKGAVKVSSPTELRIQHPTLPGKFEGLENPYRKDDAGKQLVHIEEGKVLYQQNCRPCHGSKADGNGPFADAFRLKPANFRDPGTIGTLVETYPVWRIKKGGPGLPMSATPWDSTMPPWEPDFTDEQIWKIIMGEYVTADVSPRVPEELGEEE